MSPKTLRVQFPIEHWPGWHIPSLILRQSSCNPEPGASSELSVTVETETYSDYASDSPVFRATIVRDNSSLNTLTPALACSLALKFALREDLVEDLAKEAEVYEGALRSVQGTIVPRCYGFFKGFGNEEQQIACLVLERWGECLRKPFETLPVEVRMRILNGLCELHRCGLHHCDFAERNVLVHGDDIRLIDFDQSEYHNCDWDATIKFRPVGIEKRTPDVNRDEFGCPTLREIVCRFDMENWGSGNTVYV